MLFDLCSNINLCTTVILIISFPLIWLIHILCKQFRIWYLCGRIPGPKGVPILGNSLDLTCPTGELFIKARIWAKEYYPLYSLKLFCMGCVNILAPEDFEIIMTSKKHLTKGLFYSVFVPWLGTGLLTSFGEKWFSRRKILTPAFHFQILQDFLDTFNQEAEILVTDIKTKLATSPVLNVLPIISHFTLEAINVTAMGYKLNKDNPDVDAYKRALSKMNDLISYKIVRPWCYFYALWCLTPKAWQEKQLTRVMHRFTKNVIEEKKEALKNNKGKDPASKSKKSALLNILLENQAVDSSFDDEEIREEVDTFMFEGHDTTAAALSFSLLLIANHPNIQQKLYEEIVQVIGDAKMPKFNDLQSLEYMERCIKETLRMYPSVHFIGRIAEEDFVTNSGYFVPKGTTINLHIYDLHHNSKIYPEPEKFDPDRFLPDAVKSRHTFAYLPFSAGSRNCIGQRYALLEIKSALCAILRNFVLQAVDTPETIEPYPDITLKPKSGSILVRFIPRKGSS